MTVDEVMRLASLMAMQRVQRYKATTRNGGKHELDKADAAVAKATIELRQAVETLSCTAPSTTTESASI
jgi:hypothetical protein